MKGRRHDRTNNPGSPFTVTADLEQRDDGVVVKVAEGAPFGMTASLSVQGGTLSTTTAAIAAGATESAVVPVTRGATGITVSVESVTFVVSDEVHSGIQAGIGEGLTLPPAGTYGAGGNTPATGAPTISGTAQVGQTLTVIVSGIADTDGLDNVAYSSSGFPAGTPKSMGRRVPPTRSRHPTTARSSRCG